MTVRAYRAFVTGASLAILPLTATAEVTAIDVWNNIKAASESTGASVIADVSEAGGVVTVADVTLRWALPMGVGQVDVNYGTLVLTPRGDGTVDLGGPLDQTITFGFEVVGEGAASIAMGYNVSGYSTIASGEPGDVTYDYSIDSAAVTFENVEFTGDMADGASQIDVEGEMSFADMTGSYRITEADLIALTSDGSIGSGIIDLTYTIAVDGEPPVTSITDATLGAMVGKFGFNLPKGGVSLLALPAALRDGMSFSYDYTSEAQSSEASTLVGDDVMMRQNTGTGALTGEVAFDSDGLRMDFAASDYTLDMEQPLLMPLPISMAVSSVETQLDMPILETGDAVEAAMRVVMNGLTIDPGLWAMIDPGGALPQDPIDLTADMTSSVRLLMDLLDFDALAELDQTGAVPAEIEGLTINSLNVKAVGAEADMVGAVTFDNTDLETFGGFPAPDGAATITLRNAEALLDTLVQMGLATPEDMMGVTMVLSGFFRAGDNENERVTDIEIDGAAGTVTANGMRVR
ncbi:MAG: DUF2125 domain-containing protein [Pseudomonadota bacterium]